MCTQSRVVPPYSMNQYVFKCPPYCRWSSTYIQTLFSIMKVDMTKFFAVFLVYLVGFAGAFQLVLQVDRDSHGVLQEGGGMASASGGDGSDNSTL